MNISRKTKPFYLSSTLSKQTTLFSSERQITTLYVCGVTPYDDAHIGHGRCYVTFDILYRTLQAQGYAVHYCRNVTDIDDKLINRAEAELGSGLEYHVIAKKYTARFQEDVASLGCLPPTYEPRVTDHIPQIISCVQKLIDSGQSYEVEGDVYFRIASYPTYGELSGQRIADMCAGARVEVNEKKENPLDFALWKSEEEETFWQSPWGWGRPGWHIECSALGLHYLGETLDLHGGGMDLIFPHHENERAQSECITGKLFVRNWMHNAFVRVKSEKMSKSLGNFVTLRDAFARVHPMVLRYYYTTNHYRNPLDFSWDDIVGAEKAYRKIIHLLGENTAHTPNITTFEQLLSADMPESSHAILLTIIEALCNDLNVQKVWGTIFEHTSAIRADKKLSQVLARFVTSILGISLQPLPEETVTITPEIQDLLDARKKARAEKNWAAADAIRAQLDALNVKIQDEKL